MGSEGCGRGRFWGSWEGLKLNGSRFGRLRTWGHGIGTGGRKRNWRIGMSGKVLDSFALLAYFPDEPGAETVEHLLVTAGDHHRLKPTLDAHL